MEQRTYRGDIDPEGLADALMTRFNHGDLMAQEVRGQEGHVMVQIATRDWGWGAARSALSIGIAPVGGGVRVTMGEQRWLDAAASLAITGLGALVNPLSLLGRIDDIARDLGKLTLPDQVWAAVEHYVDSVGAKLGMSEKQVVVACPYCGVGNPVGVGVCSACGGSLADAQPVACPSCGFISPKDANFCSRCGTKLAGEE
jgi:DNA-directed RNA polymerase subunit RPC12/RpoP